MYPVHAYHSCGHHLLFSDATPLPGEGVCPTALTGVISPCHLVWQGPTPSGAGSEAPECTLVQRGSLSYSMGECPAPSQPPGLLLFSLGQPVL